MSIIFRLGFENRFAGNKEHFYDFDSLGWHREEKREVLRLGLMGWIM